LHSVDSREAETWEQVNAGCRVGSKQRDNRVGQANWIGGGMEMLERIINARLLFVCENYVDYECDRYIGQHKARVRERRFAQIDKKDFPKFTEGGQEHDGFFNLMDTLKTAIKDDAKLNFVIEKRDVLMEHANPENKNTQKTQKMDYIIKVEWTWGGEGE